MSPMRPDIRPGGIFPDYALPDHTGTVRKLSELQGSDPLIPSTTPMIPHTLVLKPGLVVHRVYNGYWFWGRPSFYNLWDDLRAASSEIRPDWDLSTPGLREAWDAGDYSKFHGWDRQLAGSMPTSYY